MGGLSRRAYILNKIRQEESKPILAIDAGAMLFPQPYVPPTQLPAKSAQAEGIMEGIAKMKYDAVGLAPQDLSAGTEFLLNQPPDLKLPWLSMNIFTKDDQQLLFTPYVIKSVGELSVGILGLSQHIAKGASRQQGVPDYQTKAWEKTLSNTLEAINGKTDLNILLSSMPENINRQIAKSNNEIHIIIQSGSSATNKNPMIYGNALIAQVGSRGKHIGRLDIQWQSSRRWRHDKTIEEKQTKERLDRVNWQIGRLKRRHTTRLIANNLEYKKLVKEKNLLTDRLRELKVQTQPSTEQYSSYKNNFISLAVSLPEDPEIRDIVLKTKLAVNSANKNAMAKATTPTGQRPFAHLAGWKVCQTCHKPQTDFWLKTRHAMAWDTLVKAKQQFNPECLICHVTLPTYDQKKVTDQNLLANLKEEFKTISCETCHGPARKHAQQPDHHQPRKPDEQVCLTCHTPERDDNFIFSEKLKRIRCPAAGH